MEYDVVVIGAGNGGLAAALDLQDSGKKVLLVEQHNLPGGCASSFVRGRFEFEPSLHELCNVGSKEDPTGLRRLFSDHQIDMDFVLVPDCFRAVSSYSDGTPMDVTMPSGREAFINKMEEYVPGSRESLGKLFDLFDECSSGLDYFSEKVDYDVAYALKHFPNMLRVGSYSAMRVFQALKIPQKAIDILSIYWSYLGVDMVHMSFLHYASMVRSYVVGGACIPRHTSHEMSEKLASAFLEKGGDLWYCTRATGILFENGKVSGVKTTMGEVKTRAVVADINSNFLYGSLVPDEMVPPRLRKISTARGGVYGGRMLTTYLGLDASPEELGIQDYCIFLMGTADSVKEYESMLQGKEENHFAIFLCYNIVNEDASPKGTTICSFTTFGSPKDWDELSQEEYFREKDWWAEKFITELREKTGIDLSGHIEEIETATPWTFARYLGTPEGSAYGHETRDWDDIISRTMSLGRDTIVPGVFQVGADGSHGDGYPCAISSGRVMAQRVLREMEGGRL